MKDHSYFDEERARLEAWKERDEWKARAAALQAENERLTRERDDANEKLEAARKDLDASVIPGWEYAKMEARAEASEALVADMREALTIGRQMANMLSNVAQGHIVSGHEIAVMNRLVAAWDAALSKTEKPS